MQTTFLQQDNTIFYHRSSLKKLHDFQDLNNWILCMSYFFGIVRYNKILDLEFRAIDLLFNSSFSQCDGKLISFQLHWSIEALTFDILYEPFTIFLWFNATITAYWKYLLSLFLGFIVDFLFFNHSGESIYDRRLFRLILLRL